MKKRTSIEPPHRLHFARAFWLFFMLGGLLLIQLTYNLQTGQQFHVLAYSTNVNRTDLHSLTNQERGAVGLAGLRLNTKLNQAAQGKAEHMIANNYWAHTAPDGTTPWYWFDWAGYSYTRAGENLAYGFLDSAGIIRGWMNSPGHKANVLGDYKDVGFGFANGANYQGGEYTVVVAMYGTQRGDESPAPAPTPATTVTPPPAQAPKPQPTPAPTPVSEPTTPAPAAEPAKPEAETTLSPANETQQNVPAAQESNASPAVGTVPQAQKISPIEQIVSGKSAWPLYASLGVITISTIGFGATHLSLMRHSWTNGLRYAAHHPLLDAAVVGSIVVMFFSATMGHIR